MSNRRAIVCVFVLFIMFFRINHHCWRLCLIYFKSKMYCRIVSIVAVVLMCESVQAALNVSERDGVFSIARGGRTVVVSAGEEVGNRSMKDVTNAFVRLSDGTQVWNRWRERADDGYRYEIAARADGAVELTFQSQVLPVCSERDRWLVLRLPEEVLTGKTYESVVATVRKYSVEKGVFGPQTKLRSRWLAVNGLTFDFNPRGVGDEESCVEEGWSHQDALRGLWFVEHDPAGGWKICAGAAPMTSWGGYVGAKMVLREGVFADYDVIHALRKFGYDQPMRASRLLSFGAPVCGSAYADGNHLYSRDAVCGWFEGRPAGVPAVGCPQGVNYSSVSGEGRTVYRLSGLTDGVHVLTFTAGNYTGAENGFAVSVNGVDIAADLCVPSGKVFAVTRPIRVSDGIFDIAFSGKWLVSSLAVQPLMFDGEDFAIRRGCWVVDGWEPTCFHRNDAVREPPVFATDREFRDLPAPGTEFSVTPREPPAEVELPSPDLPSLDWMRKPRIVRLFNNSSTLAELDAPNAISDYFDREFKGRNYNIIMLSGMHSRHTYLGQEERGLDAVRRITEEAHRRGMKVIDHFDATLVWNIGDGFRLMTERIPELNRSVGTGLPSYQFCIYNPDFRRKMYDYLLRDVRNGVDGFQLDEVQYWQHGCVCRHCREGFRRETGWWIPENELNPAWQDDRSPFRKRWFAWKVRKATDFFLDFRRQVKDLKPDLVLSAYAPPWAFEFSVPRVNVGRDLVDLARTFNFFGYEMCSRCVMRSARFEFPAVRVQDILSRGYRMPMWDWYYNIDWQNDYVSWALSTMAGRAPLLAEVPKDASVPDYPGFDERRGGMKRRGAHPIAGTALLFSFASRDWNAVECHPGKEFGGIGQALEALHVPYEVIGDAALESCDLARFKTLLVGAANCLSDRAVKGIRDFAAQGGTVRLSAQAGLFDERGDRRVVWPFKDVFGFEPTIEPRSDKTYERPFGKGRIAYTPALRGEEFFFVLQMVNRVCDFNPDPVRESAFRREIVACATSWWQVDAPDKVHTAIWREADGSVAIHFLNTTGVEPESGVKPAAESPVPAFPPLEKDIAFVVPEGVQAEAFSPDFEGPRTLPSARRADGSLAVTLPKDMLKVYVLVRITGGDK